MIALRSTDTRSKPAEQGLPQGDRKRLVVEIQHKVEIVLGACQTKYFTSSVIHPQCFHSRHVPQQYIWVIHRSPWEILMCDWIEFHQGWHQRSSDGRAGASDRGAEMAKCNFLYHLPNLLRQEPKISSNRGL